MKEQRLLWAMGEIDQKYVEEAAPRGRAGTRVRRAVGWAAVAAVLALTLSLPALFPRGEEAERPGPVEVNPPEERVIAVNPSDPPERTGNLFNLSGEDYVSMTYEELLAYFQVELPVAEALPDLALVMEENGFGLYRTEGRGVYFDGSSVLFADESGTRQLRIGLEKVFKMGSAVAMWGEELAFTQVNGRELAIFRYSGEDGGDCYHTEFLQGDVAWFVDSGGLTAEEFVRGLEALVEPVAPVEGEREITGEVSVIDPQARYIVVETEKGGWGVELPDGIAAEDFRPGDRVRVGFTGEPATLLRLWREQITALEMAEG